MLGDGYSEKGMRAYVSCQGYNIFLTPCTRMDARLHLGLDPELIFILDDEYSVTCVVTEVAWYSPCVMWSRGGASGSIGGGRLEWVGGWVCGRGFVGIEL